MKVRRRTRTGSKRQEIYTNKFLELEIAKYGWRIGEHTYGRPTILGEGRGNLSIGRYCSIAPNVKILLNGHNSRHTSTYPFFSLLADTQDESPKLSDPHSYSKGGVKIGNDVWVGIGAIICDGVSIGDGAIIGAGCVVRENIPDYSIAYGNPAKVVRMRFPDNAIGKLLELKWWNYDDNRIKNNRAIFLLAPEEFIEEFKARVINT